MRHLASKDDFKVLIAKVKETCRTETRTMQKDLKAIADRVEIIEGEYKETRRYTSHL